jgi:hypothetical protein
MKKSVCAPLWESLKDYIFGLIWFVVLDKPLYTENINSIAVILKALFKFR